MTYDPEYFSGYGYGVDKKRAAAYELERGAILTRAGLPARVFDYGCGTGDFLATFDDRIMRFGWDISDYARKMATEKGIVILNPKDVTSDNYDVVIFRGTIQHIPDPVGALQFAHRILKPSGLLAIIATPNTESLCYQIHKTLPALDPPRNWFIPGASELRNVLVNVGFSDIETLKPYWRSPYANPPKDIINFLLSFIKYRKHPFPGNMLEMYARKP